MKRRKKFVRELPDCVLSYIFSKLTLKDFVKTSTLSKHWLHEWRLLKTDLNFDLDNMFHCNTLQELQETYPVILHKFATRLDQFMQHYQGDAIHSIRVNFPLDDEYSYVIDSLISIGIAKGAKHIEMLLSDDDDIYIKMDPYEFPFALLSDTDSLTYLHLQNCLIVPPMEFTGLKNLSTLVLDAVFVKQDLLQGLFSNCIHLVDFTLDKCAFGSDLKIISPTLFHLKIIDCAYNYNCFHPCKIYIDALDLSSFEYSGQRTRLLSFEVPSLLKVFYNAAARRNIDGHCFGPIERLHQVENLVMITSHSQIAKLKNNLSECQNLRQLELFIDEAGDPNMGYYSILDVLMVSQQLQKLSLTIRNSPVHGPKREYVGFFHNDLKYVELHGWVCTINAIEFARHLLRNAISLKKITFDSVDKFYIGAGRWSQGSNDHRFNRNFIHKRLKDEVKGQCQLKIL